MLFVIIPTDDPNVQAAYQCANEEAAKELAEDLIREYGKMAVIAAPVYASVTKVDFVKAIK